MERFRSPLVANVISSYMRSLGVGLFTTRTVGELLWGYEDSLLTVVKKFQPELDDVFGLFYKVLLAPTDVLLLLAPDVCREFWINLPSPFLPQTNTSNDGQYVFFTGEDNYRDFSRVDTWKGKR